MGLFKKNPEKIEAKGDMCRDRDEWVKAFTYYRDAHEACREDGPVKSRLIEKTAGAKKTAFEKTRVLANRLMKEGERELAEGQLLTLRELAEEDETRAEVDRLVEALRSGAAIIGGAHIEREVDEEEEGDPAEVEFEQLLGLIREQDRERAAGMNEVFRKGLLAVAQGDFEEAAEKFEWALNSYPDEPMVLELRAQALVEIGRSDEAAALFRKLLEIEPGFVEAWVSYAVLEAAVDPEKGLEILRDGAEANPPSEASLPLHLEEAQILMRLGRLEEALEKLGGLEELEVEDATVLDLLIARALELQGEREDASAYYDAALTSRCGCTPEHLVRIGTQHVRSPFDLGADHFLLKGNHQRALDLYNIAERQVGPDATRAAKVAYLYAQMGETSAAKRLAVTSGLGFDPTEPGDFLEKVEAKHLGKA